MFAGQLHRIHESLKALEKAGFRPLFPVTSKVAFPKLSLRPFWERLGGEMTFMRREDECSRCGEGEWFFPKDAVSDLKTSKSMLWNVNPGIFC
jgi:hypothetical protein